VTDKTRTTDDEAEDPRRDKVGGSGVYPADAENVPDDAEIRFPGQWTDYDESGTSEIIPDSAIGAGQGPEKESPKEGRPRKR
jgi:hypothetical protein